MKQTENEEINQYCIYCSYCKNVILDTDEIHHSRSKDYHKFCWEQLTDNPRELKFE